MEKRWVTVYCHKGYEIQTLSQAESHEIGYRIKGIESKPFNTVDEATQAIDRLENKG